MRSLRSRPKAWIARSGRARIVLALAVVGLGAGAAIAVAGVPGSDGVIHACYQTDPATGKPLPVPNVRVIDPGAGQSCNPPAGAGAPEASLAWNIAGPAGAQGPAGPQGPAGANETGTVVSPASTPGGPVGTLTLTQGEKVAVKADLLAVATVSTGPASSAAGQARSTSPSTQIRITKLIDVSSPKLALAAAHGTAFDIATIVIYKAGTTTPGTTFKLKSAQIATDEDAISSGGETPSETLTLVATQWQTTTSGGGSALPAVQKVIGIKKPKA
ncbi:MAG TPA: type VI secretion system tube protein Hcp [Solirubrobacteraceae bacterium]